MTEQDELWQLKQETLKSSVSLSEIDQEIFKNFDYSFDGKSEFHVPIIPDIPEEFSIGVIYGSVEVESPLY